MKKETIDIIKEDINRISVEISIIEEKIKSLNDSIALYDRELKTQQRRLLAHRSMVEAYYGIADDAQ